MTKGYASFKLTDKSEWVHGDAYIIRDDLSAAIANGEPYFSEKVEATGPWEAKFLFCGKYGKHPSAVVVEPSMRVRGKYLYRCSVGIRGKMERIVE